ncbi:MAG TPA: phospholipid carrier-dependent glycosyltransferase, partial [Candidatus Limnocylindrales bacterium]
IDHPATYLAVLAAAVLGYGLRLVDLAGRRLIPLPPTRGVGFWVAGAGIAVLAVGVLAIFIGRRRVSNDGAALPPATEPAAELAEVQGPEAHMSDELEAPPDAHGDLRKPLYVPDWVMAAWGWLARPSTRPDRSASLDVEPRGRLDRLDIWVVLALVAVVMSMRVYNLGQPPQMYFDEVYHARSAAEFLQDWRYEIPHGIYEWTHPMLAKYAIAGGITLFSDDKVTAQSDMGAPVVKDAIVQVRTAESPRLATDSQPSEDTNYDTDYGDRVFVATGTEVRAYDLPTRTLVYVYSVPGAGALSAPDAYGMVYVGTSGGLIYRIDTNSLDDLRAGRTSGVAPPSQLSVRTGLAITHVSVDALPYLLVSDEAGNVVSVDLSTEGGRIVGRGAVPGAAAYAPLFHAQAAGGVAGSDPEVLVACAAGVVVLDARTVTVDFTVKTEQAATSIAPNPEQRGPSGEEYYRFYVAAGNSVMLLDQRAVAGPATVWLEADQPLRRMPGAVTSVVFDEATGITHAVGRTGDGSGWTVYAIESNGNAVFSDARLPFEPVAVGLDNATQVQALGRVRQMPDADRGALLAFGSSGGLASVDVGQFAFSWRVASVAFGALMAVCLYLLARILFSRRSVGLIVACFTLTDGMLFAQSRIAMNDAFVGGLLLLAYLIFAAIWLRVWRNRLAFWLGVPLLGLLLGLALASKWVALYAIASMCLLILVRSALGRLLTIIGLACGTGVLGWMALAEMRYQPGTGTPLSTVLVCAAVAILGAGVVVSARTSLVPDKVAVGVAAAVLAGGCLAGALIMSPGPI